MFNFNRTTYAHLALFAVNAIYGANHLIAKGVMPTYLTPNVFIAMRAVGAVALFGIIWGFMLRERIALKHLGRVALCGLFGVAVNQLFFFHGLNLSSSVNAGIIMTLNPILVAILAFLLLKERLTVFQMVGVAICAVGGILLTLTNGSATSDSIWGDLFLFINATSYALYLVLVKPLMQIYKPLTVITYVFLIGMCYVLLFPPTIPEVFATDFSQIPANIWVKIAYVIIGVTFLTYLLTVFGLKYVSATATASYIYLQPILVILFAYLFVQTGITEDYTKTITLQKMAYMLLIFTGVFMVQRKTWKRRKREELVD